MILKTASNRFLFLTLALLLICDAENSALAQSTLPVLPPGVSTERELRKGESHSYLLSLEAGQYVFAVINQTEIGVNARIYGSRGKQLAEAPRYSRGQRRLFFVSEKADEYRLEISSENVDQLASYQLKIVESRPATAEDRSRYSAQEMMAGAARLGSFENVTAATRQEMIEKYEAALGVWRKLGDRKGELDALFTMGLVNYYLDRPEAMKDFNQALILARATNDRSSESAILQNLAEAVGAMGQPFEALEYLSQGLAIARELKDRDEEQLCLYEIALLYQNMGEPQQALNYNYQLLERTRPTDNRILLLHSLCKNHLLLGEPLTSLDYCQQALSIWRASGKRLFEAATLSYIGNAYALLDEPQKELDYYNQALAIFREVADSQGEASMLNYIGRVYHSQGDQEKALGYFEKAQVLFQKISNIHAASITLRLIGEAYASLGQDDKALDCFNQSLSQLRSIKDQSNEAATLLDIARVERDLGQLIKARGDIESALRIVESISAKVTSLDLRASYLATKRDYYEFYIDLLMRLEAQQPGSGYAAEAFQASERARARSLVESLSELRIDSVSTTDGTQRGASALAIRERALRQQLNFDRNRLTQLLASHHSEQEAIAAQQAIDNLLENQAALDAEIRSENPRYASLEHPEALSLREVQSKLLDADTLLLEYSLGDAQSFVWAATPTSIVTFALPRRAVIEAAARRVYDLLTARSKEVSNEQPAQRKLRIAQADEAYPRAAAELSQLLLGPVASQLARKRLLIVADGALQYVPFGSLPAPGDEGESKGRRSPHPYALNSRPLVVDHEIVSLPSASVLAALRREVGSRSPAGKAVAVLADPVFSSDDSRVSQPGVALPAPTRTLPADVLRSAQESGLKDFVRLRFSRAEADAISGLVGDGERLEAVDFVANLATARSADLKQYRIVHFATHGLINSQHPELSGIVLSLVDQKGQPQDGFLRLNEIYDLQLNADLVVLSACQTALGKEIRGEGLIGLTRGFMYAGAPRVVASLWRIDDRATAELMTRFYRGMLKDGLRPAAALRAAQVSLLQDKRWAAPHYWAAFTIQGEWK